MSTFSFIPPKNLIDEGKGLLVVTSFEATSSVFKKANKKKFQLEVSQLPTNYLMELLINSKFY